MNKLYKPVIVRKQVNEDHFYYVDGEYRVSVTRILQEAMPTPYALRYWIGEVGNEKAADKLKRSGEHGTLVHETCGRLLRGESVNLVEEFPDPADKKILVGFVNWFADVNPEIDPQFIEFTVASQLRYAGTMDLFCKIGDVPYIIDFKTSGAVYDSHRLQLVAYQNAFEEMTGIHAEMGILHLNSKLKKGYIFNTGLEIGGKPVEISDFMTVFEVYKMLNGGKVPEPGEIDVYPERLSLKREEV